MSSHREAPEISKDPAADNTDVYAFVSPDKPDTVTLIANYLPFQSPQGGPNFYEFSDDVLYEIHISNGGDAKPDVTYQFRFKTTIRNPNTFLYNTGPIANISDPAWNRPQTYSVSRMVWNQKPVVLASNLPVPPVNVGVRSTPNYKQLADQAIHQIKGGRKVFAGQRAEGFFVDLGSIFDLGALRPFNPAHLIPLAAANGVNGTQGLNVHSIAIQVPITDLTKGGITPTDVADAKSTIGVWASASRKAASIRDGKGKTTSVGPYVQVSRLGNPLFNEVIVPMAQKDAWNSSDPNGDSAYTVACQQARVGRAVAGPLPGGVPQPGGVHEASCGPQCDSDDRNPGGGGSWLPELHGTDPGGHAATQRGGASLVEPEPAGFGRWRCGWVPQRSAGLRRRRHRGVAGHRRPDDSVGGPDVHTRWGDLGHQGWDDQTQTGTTSTSSRTSRRHWVGTKP